MDSSTNRTISAPVDDVDRLDEGGWLNDSLLMFGLSHLLRSKNGRLRARIYLQDTFFYTTLQQRGYDDVKEWTKNVDLLSYDYIVVPIHEKDRSHWWVAIICHPGKLDHPTLHDPQGRPKRSPSQTRRYQLIRR